jgi:tetratricopeptide (TPR) repeat protein
MLFHRYLGRCCVSLGNWPRVAEIFSDISLRVQQNQRGYGPSSEREAEYYLGMCEMNAKRFESALKHFYRCDELSRNLDRKETSGFMAMANLKVGMVYDVLSKRDLAIMQYQKVLSMKEYQDSHKQAEKFVKSPFVQ